MLILVSKCLVSKGHSLVSKHLLPLPLLLILSPSFCSDSCGECFPFRTRDRVPDPPLTAPSVPLHPQLESCTLQPHYCDGQGDRSLADCLIVEFLIQHLLVDCVHLIYVLTILFHYSDT